MTPLENWREIIRKTWSFKLIILSGLLSGAEMAMPAIQAAIEPLQIIPSGSFAILAILTSAAAAVARVLAQPEKAP